MKTFNIHALPLTALLACTGAMAQITPPGAPGLPPGLYVSVLDGAISLANKGGIQNFAAGQFGYTANVTQPPVMVPKNPAIQFTPPPAFSNSNAPSANGSAPKSNSVDCEVR